MEWLCEKQLKLQAFLKSHNHYNHITTKKHTIYSCGNFKLNAIQFLSKYIDVSKKVVRWL